MDPLWATCAWHFSIGLGYDHFKDSKSDMISWKFRCAAFFPVWHFLTRFVSFELLSYFFACLRPWVTIGNPRVHALLSCYRLVVVLWKIPNCSTRIHVGICWKYEELCGMYERKSPPILTLGLGKFSSSFPPYEETFGKYSEIYGKYEKIRRKYEEMCGKYEEECGK